MTAITKTVIIKILLINFTKFDNWQYIYKVYIKKKNKTLFIYMTN